MSPQNSSNKDFYGLSKPEKAGWGGGNSFSLMLWKGKTQGHISPGLVESRMDLLRSHCEFDTPPNTKLLVKFVSLVMKSAKDWSQILRLSRRAYCRKEKANTEQVFSISAIIWHSAWSGMTLLLSCEQGLLILAGQEDAVKSHFSRFFCYLIPLQKHVTPSE